jgi:hypothetical protein
MKAALSCQVMMEAESSMAYLSESLGDLKKSQNKA